MPNFRRLLTFLVVIAWAVGCDDGPPIPGAVTVYLVSPNGLESAAIVELDGVFDQVEAAPSAAVFSEVADGRTRIVVVMRSPGDVWFQVFAPNVNEPPTATVLEVAGPLNDLRADLEGYRLQFERVAQ
jgi:hypothetical protein